MSSAGIDRRQRALGQRAVTDLAAARAGEAADFADRERREVVVQHEALVELAGDVLDLLLVVGGAERAGDQRLRLAAREDDRAVDARAARRPRSRSGGSRRTCGRRGGCPCSSDLVAHHLLLELVEDVLGVGLPLRLGLVVRRGQSGRPARCRPAVAVELVLDAHRVGERPEHLGFDLGVERRVDLAALGAQLLLAGRRLELVDGGDDLS